MHQPYSYRFYGRARQPSRRTAEAGPPIVCVYTQCGESVGDDKSISALVLGRLCCKCNNSNTWRQLDPKRALACLAGGVDDSCGELGVSTIFDASGLYIWAGDVEFIGCQPVCIFKDTNHFYVFGDSFTENIRDDG